MSENEETLLEFPCDFMVKAMGKDTGEFDALVVGLVRRHAPDLLENAVKTRASKGGKYLSVSVTVRAESKEHLDNIYRELTACEEILWAM